MTFCRSHTFTYNYSSAASSFYCRLLNVCYFCYTSLVKAANVARSSRSYSYFLAFNYYYNDVTVFLCSCELLASLIYHGTYNVLELLTLPCILLLLLFVAECVGPAGLTYKNAKKSSSSSLTLLLNWFATLPLLVFTLLLMTNGLLLV